MMPTSDQIIRAFQDDLIAMMESEFDERVSMIVDPETNEVTLLKLNGGDISESEFFALQFFEMGWNSCVQSIERLHIETTYPTREEDTNDFTGRTD